MDRRSLFKAFSALPFAGFFGSRQAVAAPARDAFDVSEETAHIAITPEITKLVQAVREARRVAREAKAPVDADKARLGDEWRVARYVRNSPERCALKRYVRASRELDAAKTALNRALNQAVFKAVSV